MGVCGQRAGGDLRERAVGRLSLPRQHDGQRRVDRGRALGVLRRAAVLPHAEFVTLAVLGLLLVFGAAWWLRLRAVRIAVRAGVRGTRAGEPRDSRHAAAEPGGDRRGARDDRDATRIRAGSGARRIASAAPSGRPLPARGARIDSRAAQQLDEAAGAGRVAARAGGPHDEDRKASAPSSPSPAAPGSAQADADVQLLRIAQEAVANAVSTDARRTCTSRCSFDDDGVRADDRPTTDAGSFPTSAIRPPQPASTSGC